MVIIFLGLPGAGKGTQSQELAKYLEGYHFSPGNNLREAIAHKDPLGLEAQTFMEKGALVPDSLILKLMETTLSSKPSTQDLILDGFPRSLSQDTMLRDLLAAQNRKLSAALYLHIDHESLISRLSARAQKEGRHDDQDRDIVAQRIREYEAKTSPLIEVYTKESILHKISGIGSIEHIQEKIHACLRLTK